MTAKTSKPKIAGATEGQRIRSARGERHQEEVARAAGVSPTHLSRIETGSVAPNLDTLKALAKALGVRARDLVAE